MTTVLIIFVICETAALVAAFVLYRRAKKAQRKRVVEGPNSDYKSQYVLDLEAQERWERVDLSRLHEVNREEFEKILARVQATSVRALQTHERAFLDRMADTQDVDARGGASKRPSVEATRRRHAPGTS